MGRRGVSRLSRKTGAWYTAIALAISLIGCDPILDTPELSVWVGERQLREDERIDFGEVEAGSSSEEMTFTIKNSGVSYLVLPSEVVVAGVDASAFLIGRQPEFVISPEDQSTFTMTFQPSGAVETKTATVSIASNVEYGDGVFTFLVSGFCNQDTTEPTVTITTGASDPTNTSPIPIEIIFSEVVSGFEDADIVVGNGTAGDLQSDDDIAFTVDVTPAAEGPVTVDVPANVANDASGNGNIASNQASITLDTTAPTVLSVDPINTAVDVPTTTAITVTFSERMTIASTEGAFALAGVGVVLGSFAWSSGDTVLTFSPASDLSYYANYSVEVGASAADEAGNVLGVLFSSGFAIGGSVGILDTTFGTGGIAVHDNAAGGNGHDIGYAIAPDASGKILVAGYSGNGVDKDMVIWRYNSDGTIDTTFGIGGVAVHDNAAGGNGSEDGYAIALDAQGKILIAGDSENAGGDEDVVIWRYNANGKIDTSFGAVGVAVHDNAAGGNGDDHGYAIALDASGKILVAGSSYNGGDSDMVIWRYNSDGTIDTTFGASGVTVHDNTAGYDNGYAIALDAQGKILVAGSFYVVGNLSDMVIWRYNSDGTIDTTFGTGGVAVHDNAAGGGGYDYGRAIAQDASGKIFVAGYSDSAVLGTNYDMVIWRYNSDGTIDTTFGASGVAVHDYAAGGDDYGRAIAQDASGKILVAGYSQSAGGDYDYFMVIWRYTAEGAIDTTTFGTGGVAVHYNAAGRSGYDHGYAIAQDASGKILVAGYSYGTGFDHDMVIWRYIAAHN